MITKHRRLASSVILGRGCKPPSKAESARQPQANLPAAGRYRSHFVGALNLQSCFAAAGRKVLRFSLADSLLLGMAEIMLCAVILIATPTQSWSQQPAASDAWTARMVALDEEHDAQAGVAVSIVFDDSGSMNDNRKLEMAKQAFHTWIEHAPSNDRFGLTAINAGPLVQASAR